MSNEETLQDSDGGVDTAGEAMAEAVAGIAKVPDPPMPPVESRFMFVDLAALRAKQLRRGALPRLSNVSPEGVEPRKLERVAMDELAHGLIVYEIPPPGGDSDEASA